MTPKKKRKRKRKEDVDREEMLKRSRMGEDYAEGAKVIWRTPRQEGASAEDLFRAKENLAQTFTDHLKKYWKDKVIWFESRTEGAPFLQLRFVKGCYRDYAFPFSECGPQVNLDDTDLWTPTQKEFIDLYEWIGQDPETGYLYVTDESSDKMVAMLVATKFNGRNEIVAVGTAAGYEGYGLATILSIRAIGWLMGHNMQDNKVGPIAVQNGAWKSRVATHPNNTGGLTAYGTAAWINGFTCVKTETHPWVVSLRHLLTHPEHYNFGRDWLTFYYKDSYECKDFPKSTDTC